MLGRHVSSGLGEGADELVSGGLWGLMGKLRQECRSSLWGGWRGDCGGFGFRDGDGVAGEEVFLMEGGAGELEGELVEAFFEEAVDLFEGGLAGSRWRRVLVPRALRGVPSRRL